jgi:Methyltransferase domain
MSSPNAKDSSWLLSRLDYFARTSRTLLRHPLDGAERVRGRLDRRRDRRAWEGLGRPATELYGVVRDWQPVLHEALGAPWPCGAAERFPQVWSDLVALSSSAGIRLGRATYRGWNDGDPEFARAVWCAVAHLRPRVVVETGVAHGVTSRVILEALELNGHGHLWSIDLPAVDPSLHSEIGVAVPRSLRHRWAYLEGTSRSRLPALLAEAGEVGVFVHDSLHTGRNVRFELEAIWPALSDCGVAVVDDIDHSPAFHSFTQAAAASNKVAATHQDEGGIWGVAVKGGSRRPSPSPGGPLSWPRSDQGARSADSARGDAEGTTPPRRWTVDG